MEENFFSIEELENVVLPPANQKWIDKGTYYLSTSPQGSDEWKRERIGRITMSNIARTAGHSDFDKLSDVAFAETLLGITEKTFSDISKYRMKRGTDHEDIARKKLELELGKLKEYKNIKITTAGLAVWKQDQRFGASLDGVVEIDGVESDIGVEIKCPEKMYNNIKKYIDSGCKGDLGIYPSHYDQMIGNGIVTNKKHMIYCVYGIDDEQLAWFKIPVDHDYWRYELYPKACEFYEGYMKNKIVENNIKVQYI